MRYILALATMLFSFPVYAQEIPKVWRGEHCQAFTKKGCNEHSDKVILTKDALVYRNGKSCTVEMREISFKTYRVWLQCGKDRFTERWVIIRHGAGIDRGTGQFLWREDMRNMR